ncbi:hypothetical protein BLX87_21055 [Bacillus sp. VT-16-64]|nr:hypothetical protein BLX87_21055 [Bacillus sp. VT-16-64]
MKFHFIPHVRCRKTPNSKSRVNTKGLSGSKRHLNARLVQLSRLIDGVKKQTNKKNKNLIQILFFLVETVFPDMIRMFLGLDYCCP